MKGLIGFVVFILACYAVYGYIKHRREEKVGGKGRISGHRDQVEK